MHKTQPGTRGIPVWGERLKELRKRKGWTQQELAYRSGYCERLIRKAELHGSVSEGTLEVLAITLSDAELQVTAEDLSLSAKVAATALHRAICEPDKECLTRLIQCSQPDIEIDCRRIAPGLPLHDQYLSQGCVADWYTPLFCLVASDRVTVESKFQVDDSQHGYIHASCLYTSEDAVRTSFDIDLRFHLADFLIQRIVWLSSLEEIVPFASEWDQLIKVHYQSQIQMLYKGDYAKAPA